MYRVRKEINLQPGIVSTRLYGALPDGRLYGTANFAEGINDEYVWAWCPTNGPTVIAEHFRLKCIDPSAQYLQGSVTSSRNFAPVKVRIAPPGQPEPNELVAAVEAQLKLERAVVTGQNESYAVGIGHAKLGQYVVRIGWYCELASGNAGRLPVDVESEMLYIDGNFAFGVKRPDSREVGIGGMTCVWQGCYLDLEAGRLVDMPPRPWSWSQPLQPFPGRGGQQLCLLHRGPHAALGAWDASSHSFEPVVEMDHGYIAHPAGVSTDGKNVCLILQGCERGTQLQKLCCIYELNVGKKMFNLDNPIEGLPPECSPSYVELCGDQLVLSASGNDGNAQLFILERC